MNDSVVLAKSQISQNLARGYNDFAHIRRNEGNSFDDGITRYSEKNFTEVYQFFIYILLFTPPTEIYKCVGSLLKNNWVLTAASCIVIRGILVRNIKCIHTTTGEYAEYLSKRLVTSFDEEIILPHIEERSILNYKLHPDYSSITGVYDLALMKVNKRFTRNNYIKPIKQPINLVRTHCWVIGIVFQNENTGHLDSAIKTINSVKVTTKNIKYVGPTLSVEIPIRKPIIRVVYNAKNACMGELGVPLICNGKLVGVGVTPIYLVENDQELQPQLLIMSSCKSDDEYYFNYLIDCQEWMKDTTPIAGYIGLSIYFNTNSVLITLPLVSIW